MNTGTAFRAKFRGKFREHVPLAQFTTYKIGGTADLFMVVRNAQELAEVAIEARTSGLPVHILGGGSNVLIGDGGIRGLVIKNISTGVRMAGMRGSMKSGRINRSVSVEADSGLTMNSLVRYTLEASLSGLEMHLGLPGTVGGALYMNSKWTHPVGYVGDVVTGATILTPENHLRTVSNGYFRFGYDQSILQSSGDIVLSVSFGLIPADSQSLWDVANASVEYRQATQPKGVSTAGCTFRNISALDARTVGTPNHITSAGFLVDSVGLKGYRIGQAMISEHHANFIINLGGATASDVVQLIELARQKVFDRYHIRLQEEIVRIGEFDT